MTNNGKSPTMPAQHLIQSTEIRAPSTILVDNFCPVPPSPVAIGKAIRWTDMVCRHKPPFHDGLEHFIEGNDVSPPGPPSRSNKEKTRYQ